MVHEDEWTVGQAAQAPQERNRVGAEEIRQFAAMLYGRNQPRWVKRMAGVGRPEPCHRVMWLRRAVRGCPGSNPGCARRESAVERGE